MVCGKAAYHTLQESLNNCHFNLPADDQALKFQVNSAKESSSRHRIIP